MTCRAAQSGTFPPAAPPRWAPCKGTYQGLFHGTVALHHTAILVNQELGEVPLDSISQHAPPLGLDFHPLPQRVGIVPVDTDLAEQIEFDIIAGGEVFDLGISPWLL